MNPMLTMDNSGDRRLADAKASREFGQCDTFPVKAAHVSDILFRDFSPAVAFTARARHKARPWSASLPTFVHHVLGVVFVRAEKQVVRVDAVAHVAPVTDKQAVRDGANKQGIGKSVSRPYLALMVRPSMSSRRSASPEPATISLLDLRPEAAIQRGLGLMPEDTTKRLTLLMAELRVRLFGEGRRLTTPALTELRCWGIEINRQLLYVIHVSCLLTRRLAAPGVFLHRPDFLLPDYTTLRG
jgi:hypothetical protein